jgi:hypothetical protein
MKKLLTILGVAMTAALAANGQGFIIVQSTAANITTNTSSLYAQGQGSPVSGKTATAANGFYYSLLFSATTPTGNTDPLNGSWSLATLNGGGTLVMNNYVLAGAISGSGTSGGVAVNMAAGTTYSVELVGWSSNLGTTFAHVLGEYNTGVWDNNAGFFGFTGLGSMTPFATAGAGDPSIFPGTFANGALTLYNVAPIPEPATMALVGLGGLGLLALRRKK